MNIFHDNLSKDFAEEQILLASDGASWHKSGRLVVPRTSNLIFLPTATPEKIPIEQIWKEICKRGVLDTV